MGESKIIIKTFSMNNLFIIPQANNSIIAQIIDGNVNKVGHINISFNSKSVITDNGLIISLCFDAHTANAGTINPLLIAYI